MLMELTPICGPWNPCQHKNLNRRDKVQRKVCLQTLHEVDNRARQVESYHHPQDGKEFVPLAGQSSAKRLSIKQIQTQTLVMRMN